MTTRMIDSNHAGRILCLTVCYGILWTAGCGTNKTNPSDASPDGTPVIVQQLKDVQIISTGLNTPAGIAIQPSTGDLFVSTFDGVFRIDPRLPLTPRWKSPDSAPTTTALM